eukprot:m.10420 g.10420  ORF g.10420 m.10420 type:complete len:455 (-) comp5561_c0_seq1:191-1555(-)
MSMAWCSVMVLFALVVSGVQARTGMMRGFSGLMDVDPLDGRSKASSQDSWDPTVDERFESSFCNVDRVENMTPLLFREKYDEKLPVIIRGRSHLNEAFARQMERKKIINNYGREKITVTSQEGRGFRYRAETTFRQYLKYMDNVGNATSGENVWYYFADTRAVSAKQSTPWTRLLTQYRTPAYGLQQHMPVCGRDKKAPCSDLEAYHFQVGIGPAGSGLPFHFHTEGFNEVLHGRKRFFLIRPNATSPLPFNPLKTQADWFLNTWPKLRPNNELYDCVIEPGETIYFPSSWLHATINLNDCVFMAGFHKRVPPKGSKEATFLRVLAKFHPEMWSYRRVEQGNQCLPYESKKGPFAPKKRKETKKFALDLLTTFRKDNPREFEVYDVLGSIRMLEGKHLEALALFEECHRLNPLFGPAWVKAADAEMWLNNPYAAYKYRTIAATLGPVNDRRTFR